MCWDHILLFLRFLFLFLGIEIVNPNAAEKKAEEEDGCSTYFSNTADFVKLKPRNLVAGGK